MNKKKEERGQTLFEIKAKGPFDKDPFFGSIFKTSPEDINTQPKSLVDNYYNKSGGEYLAHLLECF